MHAFTTCTNLAPDVLAFAIGSAIADVDHIFLLKALTLYTYIYRCGQEVSRHVVAGFVSTGLQDSSHSLS